MKKIVLFLVFTVLMNCWFINEVFAQESKTIINTEDDEINSEDMKTSDIKDVGLEKITGDMEGVLPIVKLIGFTYNYKDELIPSSIDTGVIVSEDGFVLNDNSEQYSFFLSEPSDYDDPVGFEEPDFYNVCFVHSDNLNEFDCSGIASFVDIDFEYSSMLKIVSDIDGNPLTFDNYLNYYYDQEINPNEIIYALKSISILDSKFSLFQSYITTNSNYPISSEYFYYPLKSIFDESDDYIYYYDNNHSFIFDENGNLIGSSEFAYSSNDDKKAEILIFEETETEIFLDIMNENKDITFTLSEDIKIALKDYNKKYSDINSSNSYSNDDPVYRFSFPSNWEANKHLYTWGYSFYDFTPFLFTLGKNGIRLSPSNSDYYTGNNNYAYFYDFEYPSEVDLEVIKSFDENISEFFKEFIGDEFLSIYDSIESYNSTEVSFLDKYEAIKSAYVLKDGNDNLIEVSNYYIPYGKRVVGILTKTIQGGGYEDDIEKMISSFELDMDEISTAIKTSVEYTDPVTLKVDNNPLENGWYFDDTGWYFYTPLLSMVLPNYSDTVYFRLMKDFLDSDNIIFSYKKIFDDNGEGYDALYKEYGDDLNDIVFNTFFREIFINAGEITIDGLKGEYKILNDYVFDFSTHDEIPRRVIMITVWDENKQGFYNFVLVADEENYDEYVEDFKEILRNTRLTNTEEPGEYILPEFDALFSDVYGHKYDMNILNLAADGVVEGYDDGTFKPDISINRAEFLKIVLEGLSGQQKEDFNYWLDYKFVSNIGSPYSDVDPNDWYAKYVLYATEKEIVEGYGDGNFYPNKEIIIPEALKMIYLAYGVEIEMPEDVTDAEWFVPYMDAGYRDNVIPEDISGYDHKLTRGEMCYIIDNDSRILLSSF